MKLTRKKAIELCIDLWTYLARTGKGKTDWPRWEKYKKYGTYKYGVWSVCNDCWFCEYTKQKSNAFDVDCHECPLPIYTNTSFRCELDRKLKYRFWNKAKTKMNRKKYAKLFLEQIRGLK